MYKSSRCGWYRVSDLLLHSINFIEAKTWFANQLNNFTLNKRFGGVKSMVPKKKRKGNNQNFCYIFLVALLIYAICKDNK